jgi:hypothetical protein
VIDVMNPDSDDLDSSSGKITRQEPAQPDFSAAGEVRMVPVQFSAWMPGGTDAFRGPTFSTGSGFPPSILPPGQVPSIVVLCSRRFPRTDVFRSRCLSSGTFSPADFFRGDVFP